MKAKLIFILAVCLMLSGCFESLKKTVYVSKSVFVKPDASMTKNCKVSNAPNKADYLTTPVEQREETLYLFSKSLLSDIATCNLQWKTFREWNDKQDKIYNATVETTPVVPITK